MWFNLDINVEVCFFLESKNNNMVVGYALKADIKHYFETVDHNTLVQIISKRVKDKKVLWLIEVILKSHKTKIHGKGMPLGNMTSQFFANVYLNELDQFVKHKLKAKYYLRYVDDFVILYDSKQKLKDYRKSIAEFLKQELKLELHQDKCKVFPLYRGVGLLGFRVFYYFKLLRKRNISKLLRRIKEFREDYKAGAIAKENIIESMKGWNGYATTANTYKLREKLSREISKIFEYQHTLFWEG